MAEGVDDITLTVSGPGMSTIEEGITTDTDAVVLNIPVGSDRIFEVTAGQYSARSVKDVPPADVEVALRFSGQLGLIAAEVDRNFDLSTVAPHAAEVNRLTDTPEQNVFYAQYAPDGSQIVFLKGDYEAGGTVDLYVMEADGTNEQLVASHVPVAVGPD